MEYCKREIGLDIEGLSLEVYIASLRVKKAEESAAKDDDGGEDNVFDDDGDGADVGFDD